MNVRQVFAYRAHEHARAAYALFGHNELDAAPDSSLWALVPPERRAELVAEGVAERRRKRPEWEDFGAPHVHPHPAPRVTDEERADYRRAHARWLAGQEKKAAAAEGWRT